MNSIQYPTTLVPVWLITGIIIGAFNVQAQDERDINYSFATANKKVVQLTYNATDSIFTYRFLSKGKIELEITDNLKDDDTVFTVHGYHRGGGAQNAAMDYNNVYFSNNGYDYDIYYYWSVSEEDPEAETEPSYGVKVHKNGEEIADIKGTKVIAGEVYGWSFHDILPVVKDR